MNYLKILDLYLPLGFEEDYKVFQKVNKKVSITEVVLRDGNQSLLSTR